METLKSEEVYCNEYRDLAGARSEIREFIEKGFITRSVFIRRSVMCRRAEFEAILVAPQKEAAARQLS